MTLTELIPWLQSQVIEGKEQKILIDLSRFAWPLDKHSFYRDVDGNIRIIP